MWVDEMVLCVGRTFPFTRLKEKDGMGIKIPEPCSTPSILNSAIQNVTTYTYFIKVATTVGIVFRCIILH